MNIGLEQIIWAVIAAIIAYLGFRTGRSVERPRAIQEGKEQAYRDVEVQSKEQAFERVNAATEAGADVERRSADVVRDEAGSDPYNRGRVQRP